jgi:hypothetical protein
MAHVTLTKPVSLETWQTVLQGVDPDTTFHDYPTVFDGPQPCAIAARLKEILDEFGPQVATAVFASEAKRSGAFGWTRCTTIWRSSLRRLPLDEFDGVLVNSIG